MAEGPDARDRDQVDVLDSEACLNCGAAVAGPYCARCGQKQAHTDLTMREFLHEATQELTHWDGKVPRTLETLFFKPGLLTLDFLAGRGARWLPPLRLYLICSVAFFLSEPLVEAITRRSGREVASITIRNPDGTTTLTPEGRQEMEQGIPARIFGTARLERAAANSAQLNREIDSAFPKAMFVLLPIFALLTRLAWGRKLPRYPAHLYAALHLHAAWFGAFAVARTATAVFPWNRVATIIGMAALAYGVWYALLALRRIFGDSWMKTIAKAVGITVAYFGCLFVVSLMMLAYALMRI